MRYSLNLKHLSQRRVLAKSLFSVMFFFCSGNLLASSPACKLYNRLIKIQKSGYMYGHQDDPFYGLTWEWDYGRSDVKELVGDYPAIMGFELGGIEMGDRKSLDSVPFSRIHDEIINHYERGGIITISWHPRNPLTGGTAWDVTSDQVVKSILPGGSKHEKFQLWMKRMADFLVTLKDKKGQPIPFILRPWHENNGSWFWWGRKLCTPAEYKALWNMLQDYLDSRLSKNVLYSYSPNLDGGHNDAEFLERYPGDNRVAVIGQDAYQWGPEEQFVKGLTSDLDYLSNYAHKHKKLYAVTECGYKNCPDSTWWTRVLKPILDKYDILYFLNWRNDKKEYFGPAKGFTGDNDFVKLYESTNTLFLKEIKNK